MCVCEGVRVCGPTSSVPQHQDVATKRHLLSPEPETASLHALRLGVLVEALADIGVVLCQVLVPVRQRVVRDFGVARNDVDTEVDHVVRVLEETAVACGTGGGEKSHDSSHFSC